jgi:arylsulfatase
MDGKKETERRDLQLLLLLIALACIFCAPPTDAQQFDAPFTKAQKQNAAAWEQEDRAINARLAELKKKHGKSPNIIYILADDIGWGELGSYGGGRNRGTPTPNLDALAADGMKFMSHYSEPSCTPTRLALMTGRHPVRTGVDIVLWPGQTQGDLDRHAPERQGFDYAYYGLYNGAIYSWFNQDRFYSSDTVDGAGYFYDFPGTFEDYEKKYGIKIRGHFEGFKGKDRKEIEPITATSMEDMERNSIRRIKDYIKEKSDSDKPFFVYWASYAQQMAASPKEYRNIEDHDRANNQSAQLAQHDDYVQQLLDLLDELDIEENTLVVWVSDNGPMYAFWPNSGYSWLRGGKGDVYEGGVRTPGIARWPGIIEPGQTVHDIISVTDLFTTAARIAGVVDDLPDDRVIDGVDQTALLVNGEGHGRRNYLFHYSGNRLAAVRMEDFKLHILSGSRGGLPNMELYNVMRDPGEKFGEMYSQLWAVVPFQRLIGSHMGMIKEYPHRELPSGTF